jgi:hypothetical protein
MTIAEIHGKLSSSGSNISDRLEDLLTSDVFSTFKYFSSNELLIHFLRKSINIKGEELSLPDNILKSEYIFWPRFEHCEPDLLLKLYFPSKLTYLVLIEAKYLSGKSSEYKPDEGLEISEIPSDQLAKEYFDLLKYDSSSKAKLIYLTAHRSIPKKSIEDSLDELGKTMQIDSDNIVYWNTWYNIIPVIANIDVVTNKDKYLLEDLELLMEKKRLVFFNGFHVEDIENVEPFLCSEKSEKVPNIFFEGLKPIDPLETRLYNSEKSKKYYWGIMDVSDYLTHKQNIR